MLSPEDWEVFSRQLRRWKEFRTWQLGNRRQTVGFSEYLDEQRREFERMGAAEFAAQPIFEQTVRQQWEGEYGHGQQQPGGDDAEAVLSRYAEAARRLLIDCGFVQPFQLHPDPKQQDQWTTYVEYLAFECFWLGRLARSAQKLRLQHDAEWEGLVKADVVKPLGACDDLRSTEVEDMRGRELERAARAARSFTAVTGTTATDTAATDMVKETRTQPTRKPRARRGQQPPSHTQKSLQSSQSPIDDIARRNDLVNEYVHDTQKYQTAKAEVDYQQRRVEWVQSEIGKIMAEQRAAGKSGSTIGAKSRKRKPIHDADLKPPVGKHKRTDETKETVVDGRSDYSRTTRSKKRKLATDEETQGPQLKTEEKVAGEIDGPGTKAGKDRRVSTKLDRWKNQGKSLHNTSLCSSLVLQEIRRCRAKKSGRVPRRKAEG